MTIKETAIASMFLAAAGCGGQGEDLARDPLPSVRLDEASPGPIGMKVGLEDLPCGYDSVFESEWVDGSTSDRSTWSITYDDQGRDVLEEGRGENAFAGTSTFDYGQDDALVHGEWERSDAPTYELWQTFDGSGNKVRYSADQDGDGEEDWVATYQYGADGTRARAHLESLDGSLLYDRVYRYDGGGRLIELERDDGADGTTDQITRVAYDDGRRVTTETTTDSRADVLKTVRTEYDAADRVIAATDDQGFYVYTEAHEYDESRLVEEVYTTVQLDDGGATELRTRITTTYDHDGCP